MAEPAADLGCNAGGASNTLPFLMRDDFSQPDDPIHRGPPSAEALLSEVYEELRKIACHKMAGQSAAHTLQPTALVHEAWMKLNVQPGVEWESKANFIAVAATAMRHILIDHARTNLSQKRGGGHQRVDLDEVDFARPERDETILIVDEALAVLERDNPEWARIVVMKYFGGMTNREVAEVLDVGERSVERYWAAAKTWLHRRISRRTEHDDV